MRMHLVKFCKDLIEQKKEEEERNNRQKDIDKRIFCFFEVFSFSSIDHELITRIDDHQHHHCSTHIRKELGKGNDKSSCLRSKISLRCDKVKEIYNFKPYESCDHTSQIPN